MWEAITEASIYRVTFDKERNWRIKRAMPNVFKKLHHSIPKLEIKEKTVFSPCFQLYGQKQNVKRVSGELRTYSQAGWCAWRCSSIFGLKIYVPRIVGDNSFRTRSVRILSTYKRSRAAMWLENNENEIIKSESLWVRTQRFDTIGHREEPVYHTITVRTLSNKKFLAAGVFVDLTFI